MSPTPITEDGLDAVAAANGIDPQMLRNFAAFSEQLELEKRDPNAMNGAQARKARRKAERSQRLGRKLPEGLRLELQGRTTLA